MNLEAGVAVDTGTEDAGGADFTRFFERESRGLVRLAYLLLADVGDAEDVVQEVLEELFRRWAGLREDSVLAYARTAVVNRARSVQRRRAVARRFLLRSPRPEETVPLGERDRWLWDLVQALPRRQREVVVLRYWCDLSEAQIADVLGISAGTVKSSAHRAYAQLSTAVAVAEDGARPGAVRKDVQ